MATFLVSGAGSGIGAVTAQRLADAGHATILLGRTAAKLDATKSQLTDSSKHQIVQADVRDKDAIRTGLLATGLNTIEGVVANAGVGGENFYGANDRWDEVVSTNLTGCYVLINECLPYLQKSTSVFKHVVLVSSILARLGVPGYSAYCASKAGMLGLMRSWAVEFASKQILVNAICPGWVETDMAKAGIEGYARITQKSYKEAFGEQMSRVLLGKMSTPDEVASLVTYLFSDEQSSFTGQVFDMNNGALMPS